MKLLHSAPNFAEISLLKSVLEQAGIASLTRNENLSLASGAIPFLECTPELWVKEEDYPQAQALLSQWQNDIEATADLEAWTCPNCQALNEAQFAECWQCGFNIDADETT